MSVSILFIIIGQGDCYPSYNYSSTANLCFSVQNMYMQYPAADMDCQIRTNYTSGRMAEIRDAATRDYLMPLLNMSKLICN